MMPHGFLQAAAKNSATFSARSVGGKRYSALTFAGQNKAPVVGYINEQNLVERVETRIDNAMLGDMPFEAVYSDYKDFGGVKFPTRIIQRQGGHPILDLTITDVKPNIAVSIQQAPQGQGQGQAPAAAAGVPTEKLGDGVYLILGGYAAIAVDFKDHILVVEGPQNEDRANAIIAKTKELIPNKPIRYVVNTHAHFDHSSGLRAFMAEGATVVTHNVNKSFIERVGSAPHTLNPDKLAQSKRKVSVEGVGDKKVFTDGNRLVELYHMKDILHQDGMLMVYFPKEKILLQADAYNPPAQATAQPPANPSPYNLALLANIDRLKLDVSRIIPVHYPADNRAVTVAEVRRWAGR
jgi:glyoxylase-like metal-dependent hydrolase (beta-lactamase superfamily II)